MRIRKRMALYLTTLIAIASMVGCAGAPRYKTSIVQEKPAIKEAMSGNYTFYSNQETEDQDDYVILADKKAEIL